MEMSDQLMPANQFIFVIYLSPFPSSVSLSSLDSEEQESLRAAERLHNRSSRNSTGGISTHSLNEAELAVCIIYFYSMFFFSIFHYSCIW